MKRIVIDFETRSECDLKRSGAYKYSLDPTTKPTCMAFKMREAKTILLDFKEINSPWKFQPDSFKDAWTTFIEKRFLFVAHNAFFEQCIYNNILVKRYGWPEIDERLWRCTAAKAAACALPRSLEGAGQVLNLSTQKDKRGYIAMMLTCKPTKHWNAWKKANDAVKSGLRITEATRKKARSFEPPKFLEYEDNPEIWQTLYTYCKIDVRTEELLDDALPDLIPLEQEIWFLNQRLNWRGLKIDTETCKKIVVIIEIESKKKLKELDTITMGLVTKPGARTAILEFLALEGIELPDIRAKTVDDILLQGKLSPDMRRLLEIRKALSKTSTKKYQTMLDRAGKDNRVRDILLYHGASTGRDTGTGIQPHNFPRNLISQRSIDSILEILETAQPNEITETILWLKTLYGENLSIAFSSLLRSMIIPSKECELYVADFSKIEVAVLWWLADNWAGLKILESGKDPYKYQAAANLGKSYDEISDDGPERQLGKAQVLGCIAEGSQVLTQRGLVNIEKIKNNDLLWDGETWVKHGGLVATGSKNVIRIVTSSIELTADHWILVGDTWLTAVETDFYEGTLPRRSEIQMQELWSRPLSLKSGQNGVSVCAAYAELKKNFEWISSGKVLIYDVIPALSQLEDNPADGKVCTQTLLLIQNLENVGQFVSTTSGVDAKTRIIPTSRGMAVAVFETPLSPLEHFWNMLLHCAGLTNGDSLWTELITTGTMSPETYESLLSQKTVRTALTYDVKQAGLKNRFQVNGEIVHNCGFRMGWKNFKETAYSQYRLTLTNKQSVEAIKSYRETNSPVVALWDKYEEAAIRAVENKSLAIKEGKCAFIYRGDFLWVTLPSGRSLAYFKPKITERVFTFDVLEEDALGNERIIEKISNPKKTLEHLGLDQSKKNMRTEFKHGGILTENIVQAIARDLMMPAMLRLEENGFKALLMVHDEGICEKKKNSDTIENFVQILCQRPKWADKHLPLEAKGWTGLRYKK